MPARPPRKTKHHDSRLTNLTPDQWRDGFKRLAAHADEYAGIPATFNNAQVVIHPSYSFAKVFNAKSQPKSEEKQPVNSWLHSNGYYHVAIYHRANGKAYHEKFTGFNGIRLLFSTIEVSAGWTIENEQRALEKLRGMIPPHLFEMYQLTGQFLETSKRSGLAYIFRRLRPTVVLTPHRGNEMSVLCCLCLHPMGYYKNSWGGVMVPTDEVVAHLTLMRGDEYTFWKQANQHPAYRKESGL